MFFRKKKKEAGPFYRKKDHLIIYVETDRGSIFKSYLRKGYDFRINYGEGAPILLDKEFVGNFPEDKLSVHAEFDANYKLISSKIQGGRFLTLEEYEELLKSKEEIN